MNPFYIWVCICGVQERYYYSSCAPFWTVVREAIYYNKHVSVIWTTHSLNTFTYKVKWREERYLKLFL